MPTELRLCKRREHEKKRKETKDIPGTRESVPKFPKRAVISFLGYSLVFSEKWHLPNMLHMWTTFIFGGGGTALVDPWYTCGTED